MTRAVTHPKETYQSVRSTVQNGYRQVISGGTRFVQSVSNGFQSAGKAYSSFKSYVSERTSEIRSEVVRHMCTTTNKITDALGKVDWKKVGITVAATGVAIGVGVLTGGVGIAAAGALGFTEGLGAAVISGAVSGAISGAAYSATSSTLSGNNLEQIAKDTLSGGLAGSLTGGVMGGVSYGAGKAVGALKNLIKGNSNTPQPGHITEMATKNLSDIGSDPQLDLGNGDPYELLKKNGIATTLSDEERAAADAYGLVAKAQIDNKPQYSPNVEKWLNKNGTIDIDEAGTWKYTNSSGQSVKYTNGYPDFKEAGMVRQEVNIGKFNNYGSDFKKADALAPMGPKLEENTWHHVEDGKTMQEVGKELHKEFTHRGGMALKNKR